MGFRVHAGGHPPGIYPGAVEIEGGKQKLRLPFRVEVFAATVPKEKSFG